MLTGAAWKDMSSSSIGGAGPYIPKVLLERFDTAGEREARRQFYREKKLDQQVRIFATAVKVLRQDGLISDELALDLDSKAHDDNGMRLFSLN